MVNTSNSAQRQATSSINCNDASSSASEFVEELEQHVDVTPLNREVRQFYYAGDQSPGEDIDVEEKLTLVTRMA